MFGAGKDELKLQIEKTQQNYSCCCTLILVVSPNVTCNSKNRSLMWQNVGKTGTSVQMKPVFLRKERISTLKAVDFCLSRQRRLHYPSEYTENKQLLSFESVVDSYSSQKRKLRDHTTI